MDRPDDLFETIANYTYDWETWFSPQGDVRWINPAVTRMTGYSVDECLAMPDYPADLVLADDRAKIDGLLRSACDGSSGNDVEFRFLRKDGSAGWAAVSWQPVRDRAGLTLGFRTSIREITKRKRAEEALRLAKADAERANAAKTRFLAAVSHDLRQPLQAISMYLGALKRAGEPARAEIVQDMGLCLQNCNALLDDLVDISRLDAGVVEPQMRPVAVADVLETVERSLREAARDKSLELRVVPCSTFVDTDPAMLARILQNLVSNAIRYTPRGRVLLGCRRRGRALSVEVWDTGIGIAEDDVAQVFEEFYQIGNPQRDRRRGVGLGLAIVRRLAALLGAGLDVRSTPGRGSTFAVTVPVSATCGAAAQDDMELAGARVLENARLLVIDDEPTQLRALTLLLSTHGAAVVGAADADGAIAALRESGNAPDLIIADYRLADGHSGADALDRTRRWLKSPVPGLILTGDTEPQRIAEAQASGYKLLHKPIEPEALMREILEAARR